MGILIGIAAIGIILLTLPLLLRLLGGIGTVLGFILGWGILIAIVIGVIVFISQMTSSDYMAVLEFILMVGGLLLFLGMVFNIGWICSKIASLLGYIFGYFGEIIRKPIDSIAYKRQLKKDAKKRYEKELKESEIRKNKDQIFKNLDELIKNNDTISTFEGKDNCIFGGPLNGMGWFPEAAMKFIGKNNLKIEALDLKNIDLIFQEENPINVSDNKNTKNLAENIENIVKIKKIEDEKRLLIKKVNNHISIINNEKNELSKVHSFIIKNLENILMLRAKEGLGLPFDLNLKDHEELKDISMHFKSNESFKFLKINTKNNKNVLSKTEFAELCFSHMSNQIEKFHKFLIKSGLAYSIEYNSQLNQILNIKFKKSSVRE